MHVEGWHPPLSKSSPCRLSGLLHGVRFSHGYSPLLRDLADTGAVRNVGLAALDLVRELKPSSWSRSTTSRVRVGAASHDFALERELAEVVL
jgi:hypothetical protein